MKIGDKVKIKSVDELLKITGLRNLDSEVRLKSGLLFHPVLFAYAGFTGTITEIATPEDCKTLRENTYKIGVVKVYWTKDLFDKVGGV